VTAFPWRHGSAAPPAAQAALPGEGQGAHRGLGLRGRRGHSCILVLSVAVALLWSHVSATGASVTPSWPWFRSGGLCLEPPTPLTPGRPMPGWRVPCAPALGRSRRCGAAGELGPQPPSPCLHRLPTSHTTSLSSTQVGFWDASMVGFCMLSARVLLCPFSWALPRRRGCPRPRACAHAAAGPPQASLCLSATLSCSPSPAGFAFSECKAQGPGKGRGPRAKRTVHRPGSRPRGRTQRMRAITGERGANCGCHGLSSGENSGVEGPRAAP